MPDGDVVEDFKHDAPLGTVEQPTLLIGVMSDVYSHGFHGIQDAISDLNPAGMTLNGALCGALQFIGVAITSRHTISWHRPRPDKTTTYCGSRQFEPNQHAKIPPMDAIHESIRVSIDWEGGDS
jgi:hypothetical protein